MRALHLTHDQLHSIIKQAQADAPHETCGLLAGYDNEVKQIIPVPNRSPVPDSHYDMEPNALLRAYKQIDQASLDVLGVYHSHPASDPIPSPQDVTDARQNLPNLAYLIVGLKSEKPQAQVWYISYELVNRVELLVGTQKSRRALPLSQAQVIVIMMVVLLAVIVLLMISILLLPAAPPLPTP